MLTQENKFLGKNLNSFYENKKQYALKKKKTYYSFQIFIILKNTSFAKGIKENLPDFIYKWL